MRDADFDFDMLSAEDAGFDTSDDSEPELHLPGGGGLVPYDREFSDAMVLGAAANLSSMPAFRQELARRAGRGVSLIEEIEVERRRRGLSFDFGPVFGPAGFTTTITLSPQCRFRGEKMMATDSALGFGTMIVSVAVGQRIQKPGNTGQGSLTKFFDQTSLANGVTYDTAHDWEQIALTIAFVQSCTFNASLFGTAELV